MWIYSLKNKLCASPRDVLANRADTSNEVLRDTSTTVCVSLCQDGVVFISGQPARCVGVFQRGGGGGWHQALSIIHLTCHHGNPPRGRARECTDEQKLVRCEREWGGDHDRRARRKE